MLLRAAALLLSLVAGSSVSGGPVHVPGAPRAVALARWSQAAYDQMANVSCAFFANDRECGDLRRLRKGDVNLYAASRRAEDGHRRLSAVLPDEPLNGAGSHDAVLVLDPFPEAGFGHLVAVFFVDLGWTQLQCQVNGGYRLEEGECLSIALKDRCQNLLGGHGGYRGRSLVRRCEIHFLPLVHLEDEEPHQSKQRLRCRPDVAGFAPCPELRPQNETDFLLCNPVRVNTQRCSTTQEMALTRCRLFETCDQALLLSGGWDRLSSPVAGGLANLRDVYAMLTRFGFKSNNVRAFYANGADGRYVSGDADDILYPSALKLALRYHLQRLCLTSHCADSLFVYLNSPTFSDGSSLLWDVDGNGQADEEEIYSIRELLFDLKNCSAKQVVVVADQNFSGELARAFARSKHHGNVLFFGSSQKEEYSWRSELTRHWTAYDHSHACVRDVQEEAASKVPSSSPVTYDGSQRSIQKTIFGAPCDVFPPYSQEELEELHFGCQNIPPSVWRRRPTTTSRLGRH
ncbi:uncharacterized protein ISCGN_018574 [Ixodes scapularis]